MSRNVGGEPGCSKRLLISLNISEELRRAVFGDIGDGSPIGAYFGLFSFGGGWGGVLVGLDKLLLRLVFEVDGGGGGGVERGVVVCCI